MKRSDVLTRCLLNAGCRLSEDDIRAGIRQTFADEFPGKVYDDWDIEITNGSASYIIRTAGRASEINVELFIRDLYDVY